MAHLLLGFNRAEDEMMGLGSFASSSSSSNLSPLAPPFTVERSNHNKLNLSSNLDSHFNGTSDGVPFISSWSNFHSSTARQGLLADSIRTATVPSANDYMIPPTTHNWSALNSGIKSKLEPINPPAAHLPAINPNPQLVIDSSSYNRTEAVPFYNPCVSWLDDDDPPLLHGYGSSRVDYSQSLSGLKYNAQQVGTWSGPSDRSRGKNLESEHSFFSEQANMAGSLACGSYMNQGAYDVKTLSKGKEDSAMLPGRHADLVREKNIGSSVIGKSFSAINQGVVSNGFSKEPWNSHRSYTPYETRDLFNFSSDLKSPSVTIKSPAALSTFSTQGAVSTKSVEISSTAAFNSNDLPLGFEAKGGCLDVNQLSFQIGRTDDHGLVDSSTMRDASNKMSTDGRLNFEFKASSSFQLPDINITKSAANLSENLDHHNAAEDSPCWKGAPTHFSPFGSPEAESLQHPMKKLHESSVSDERATEKDQKSGGAVVVEFDSSKGQAQSSCDMAKPRNIYHFLSEPSSDTNSQLKLPNLNEDFPSSSVGIGSTDGIVDHTVPASIESAANLVSTETFDVNVLVKALNSLSELLLLHCSKDECGLKEQDHKALDHVIGNLNVCMSKKLQQAPPTQKYTLPQHTTSNMLHAGVINGTTLHRERNDGHFGKNIEKLQGASLKDDDLQKDHNMVQTIKKVLDENLECKEDLPAHTLLYKNLWLEAEAELCALSYRARFHRVKREMGSSKASVPGISEVFSPVASKLIHEAAGSKTTDIHAHNVSLQSVDVENSVMGRFNILKHHGESNPVIMAEKEPAEVEVSGNEIQSFGVAEAHFRPQAGKEDEVAMGSGGTSLVQNASSDWEHVLKDEFS